MSMNFGLARVQPQAPGHGFVFVYDLPVSYRREFRGFPWRPKVMTAVQDLTRTFSIDASILGVGNAVHLQHLAYVYTVYTRI